MSYLIIKDICNIFLYLLLTDEHIYSETICISSKIKKLTGWKSNYHSFEDIIFFFKTKYPTKDGRLDLNGLSGEYLRTLPPKDYFRLVDYEREMKDFI